MGVPKMLLLSLGRNSRRNEGNSICPKVSVDIKGVNFEANLIILELMDIDVILGMGWLSTCK